MRFPGHILSLPLVAAGTGLHRALLYLDEDAPVFRGARADHDVRALRLDVTAAEFGDRIGLGVAARARLPSGPIEGAVTLTTRGDFQTDVELFPGALSLQYVNEWRPRERFHGIGSDSREAASSFAVRREQVRLRLGVERGADATQKGPRTQASGWLGPRTTVLRNGRDAGVPSFERQFPELAAWRNRWVEHLVFGLRFAHDRRSGKPHWNTGWRIMTQAERFGSPARLIALRTASADASPFTRYQAEIASGFSFGRDPRTVRVQLRLVNQDASGGSEDIPIADHARLGGAEGLHGFEAGRFHDLSMFVGKASYIFPLGRFWEFDVHVEAGRVHGGAPRISGLEHSQGFALRPRTRHGVLGRIGLDWSRESVRFRAAWGDVE